MYGLYSSIKNTQQLWSDPHYTTVSQMSDVEIRHGIRPVGHKTQHIWGNSVTITRKECDMICDIHNLNLALSLMGFSRHSNPVITHGSLSHQSVQGSRSITYLVTASCSTYDSVRAPRRSNQRTSTMEHNVGTKDQARKLLRTNLRSARHCILHVGTAKQCFCRLEMK